MIKKFDAIVIGGGHAGLEAAFALSKNGLKTILISYSKNELGSMPCNPSIGGPAKGIITKDIDALGGMQGVMADEAMIQIKMLNTSKGPAVRALRAQIDKEQYMKVALRHVESQENLTLYEGKASSFIFDKDQNIVGITTKENVQFEAKVIVITTGTYLRSCVLRGDEKVKLGPDEKESSNSFAKAIENLGITMQRFKTGTPPRIWTNSIDFSKVELEELPILPLTFSHEVKFKLKSQASCWLTYTNEETHKVIDDNLTRSSMYSGMIKGVGPRYCPSIEDKVVRFHDKNRHQLFLEPETIRGDVIYLSGFSTSMPIEIQEKMLKTLPGFAKVNVKRWAYAIEYDAIDPLELNHSLSSKKYPNLFFAGQINGTSGYEEAAGQGLMAGINAARFFKKLESIVLKRYESYIGVLIDDLVIKGTKEPYRMLTSRAEYRLLLRNDNADLRLSEHGFIAGLISKQRLEEVQKKWKLVDEKLLWIDSHSVSSKSSLAKKYGINHGETYGQILRRPNVDPKDVVDFEFSEELAIVARLDGYIKKQNVQAEKMNRLENLKLPIDINYETIPNLAFEARQKLVKIRPENIGQASRISGINPSDIQMLMYYMKVKNEN